MEEKQREQTASGQVEKHKQILQSLCRCCGDPIRAGGPKRSKLVLAKEILFLYSVDVKNEDDNTFPPNICSADASVLYRCRQARKTQQTYSTSKQMVTFTAHTETCQICIGDQKPPKKQKIAHAGKGPGRGKRESHIMDPPVLEGNASPKSDYLDHAGIDADQNKEDQPEPDQVVAETDQDGAGAHQTVENDTTPSLYDVYSDIPANQRQDALSEFVDELCDEEKKLLLAKIFQAEQVKINRDISSISRCFGNIDSLAELDILDYLGQRNDIVITVLENLTQSDLRSDPLRAAMVLETLYKLKHGKFVGPISSMLNMTLSQLTGSKTAIDLVGCVGAGGIYSTVTKTLQSSASTAPACPPGDIVCMFDNEQIVGKTWNIKPQNKVTVSVVTNVAAAQLTPETKYENRPDLHPAQWYTKERVDEKIDSVVTQDNDEYENLKKEHTKQLQRFIEAAIEQVLEEEMDSGEDAVDLAVQKMNHDKEFKTCHSCGNVLARLKRKCPNCGADVTKKGHSAAAMDMDVDVQDETSESNDSGPQRVKVQPIKKPTKAKQKAQQDHFERYAHVESGHGEPVSVHVLDPVLTNPNSYDNLVLVLRHIGQEAGLKRYGGTEREFLLVSCDGLPYTMVLRLSQEYLVCVLCHEGCLGHAAYEQHKLKKHGDSADVQHVREFDWVVLVPGDGHYEMNSMKAFFNLNWDVFMKQLVFAMGWISVNAQRAARNCYDNHKTWQMILIFHLATLLELVTTYVRASQSEDPTKPITVEHFFQYAESRQDEPNFSYMFQMVTKCTQSIVNLRMGVRRNNYKLIQAGKLVGNCLFHGRNHPRYQQIEMVEAIQVQLMPQELRSFVQEHASITRSDHSKGQGFDFILEEVNKDVKSWINRGVATDQTWITVCRNCDKLKKIRTKLSDILRESHLQEPVTKPLDLEDAIFEWRVCLREKGYLADTSYIHKSLSGEELCSELVNFVELSKRKRRERLLQTFVFPEGPEDASLTRPVFVTQQEQQEGNALENQTVAAIDAKMVAMLPQLSASTQSIYRAKLTEVQRLRMKKEQHIKLFHEMSEACDSESISTEEEPVLQ